MAGAERGVLAAVVADDRRGDRLAEERHVGDLPAADTPIEREQPSSSVSQTRNMCGCRSRLGNDPEARPVSNRNGRARRMGWMAYTAPSDGGPTIV